MPAQKKAQGHERLNEEEQKGAGRCQGQRSRPTNPAAIDALLDRRGIVGRRRFAPHTDGKHTSRRHEIYRRGRAPLDPVMSPDSNGANALVSVTIGWA
jgi:hypothetical protein